MMPITDRVSISLDQKLHHISLLTKFEYCIHRVCDRLREQNEKAYEPEIVAIGPYDQAKPNLQAIQDHKLWYLHLLLRRRNEPSVHRYVTAMRALHERALRCYAQPTTLEDDAFVEMMLLDSCFIVELLRRFTIPCMRNSQDHLFKMDWILPGIWQDLMLFENQLPFFLIAQFFHMTKVSDPRDNLPYMATLYYCHFRRYYVPSKSPFPEVFVETSAAIPTHNTKHLLGLMHSIICSSFQNAISEERNRKRWEFIHCATDLHESGIKFRKTMHDTSVFDIKFENGTLLIPAFSVDERFEPFLRNLIAYEQLLPETSPKCVTDYVTTLFCLINSSKDVSLLRRHGILNNMLGDDKAASTVLSKVSTCVFVSGEGFCYSEVFNSINSYCRRRQNIWTATLKRKHFNNPWAIISFGGAVVLLLLTFIQSGFSVLSYVACKC